MLILLVKLVSLLLLNGFIFSYQSGGYDLRWIAFGVLCSSFMHYPIWLEKVRFESEELTWFLNLPRSIFLKIGQQLVSFGFLLLPELILLGINFPGFHSLQLIPLLFGVNLGSYGLVIFQYKDIDWTKVIIGSFFLVFILIIFSVPLWLLFILSLSAFVIGIKSPYRV
jgi:hypothetical protein